MESEGKPALNLIVQLCKALELNGIGYCHWKSNAAINRSACGENDLDLLVKRSDIQRFREILNRLDFKECLTYSDKYLPGVQNYFGYDHQSDKFIHVHAHYQLVIGHDLSKNYHLPVEIPYLDSAHQNGIFRIPSSEFELTIFVIRMMIKHSTWDTILFRNGVLSQTEKQELVYLETKADRAKVDAILKQHLPFISIELFDECLHALHPGSSLNQRLIAGYRLQNRLKVHARRPLAKDLFLRQWRLIKFVFQSRVFNIHPKFRLANGGALVAIVGGDGAGKTTVVDELFIWLSRHFDIKKIHMGKPPWSMTTIIVRGILKIGNILHFYPFEKASVEYGGRENNYEFPGYPWLIREVCTARDRLLAYKCFRRYASNGSIVVCDRYHIQQIRFMESPDASIRMTNLVKNSWLAKYLIRLETNMYQQIIYPDILIVLRLDPEIAVKRKSDEDEFSVRARSTEIWEFNWKDMPVNIIDASHYKEVVLSKIKSLVWSEL
jgi:thymidylate kinase